MVSRADKVFNAAGELTDEVVRRQLGQYVQNYAAFVRRSLSAAGTA
jgi:hypothetical protein